MQLFLFVNKLTGFFCGFFSGFLLLNFPLLIGFNVVFLLVLLLAFLIKNIGFVLLQKFAFFGLVLGLNFTFRILAEKHQRIVIGE